MLNKLNSFWGGFIIAFILSFITAYVTWPKLPVPPSDRVEVVLPKSGDPAGISYPRDGEKLSGVFIVYGSGIAFENQGTVGLVDGNGKQLLTQSVHFHAKDISFTGPFITAMDLTNVKLETETGVVELYEEDAVTGKKKVIDNVNVRFK